MRSRRACMMVCAGLAVWFSRAEAAAWAAGPSAVERQTLAKAIASLDGGTIVLGPVRSPPLASMLGRHAAARLRQAGRAEQAAWEQVRTPADWEAFRDARLARLRSALGAFPPAPAAPPRVRVTKTLEGDGFRIDNIVYDSRPGLTVTANLYRPVKPGTSMPGVVLCHLHQWPKFSAHCQSMAMTWARAGCVVLVPDHLGHGERRQHPFGSEADYQLPYPSPRHDYHGRFDTGVQLYLAGESLMGWLAWDLMRGVDVLCAAPGVDAKRILLVSEPAGGGDVAAVTAALDARISCAVVTNFGGPQPETAYPLTADAEASYDFIGSGSWESTRNLRRSARDGFLPWFLLAAAAPRKMIYNHEFYWDREHDPVWRRLERVYGFYGPAADRLRGTNGQGFVVGSPPANTHWLAINREILYPTLEKWLGISSPQREFRQPRDPRELLCLSEADRAMLVSVRRLVKEGIEPRQAAARQQRAAGPDAERSLRMRRAWADLLGDVAPAGPPIVRDLVQPLPAPAGLRVERLHLAVEPGIVVPTLLLLPAAGPAPPPVVVAVSQQGKQRLLAERSEPIAELLLRGVAVCLVDVRGTGETDPETARDWRSASTSIAASELMLGETLLAGRLRDLRSALAMLRQRSDVDGRRIALWGLSLQPANAAEQELNVPRAAADRPWQAEPLGGLLALLGTLYEDDVRAALVQGGLADYASLLDEPLGHVPFDAIVPGLLPQGDLDDLTAVLAPRPVRLESLVDGQNRALDAERVRARYPLARRAFTAAGAGERLEFWDAAPAVTAAPWLAERLAEKKR